MNPAHDWIRWFPRVGGGLVVVAFLVFIWGLHHRSALESRGEAIVRMLFVPSVEQGTLVRRGDELARFVREDSGIMIRSAVPTSYAAVIQALGTDQADIAWIPAFAYVLAADRHGAEARLQVVRALDLFAILVARTGAQDPAQVEALAGRRIAWPASIKGELRRALVDHLDRLAPGWVEVPVADDREAVRLLVERPDSVDAAASTWVFSGPHDRVGDGRKLLEYERPGTLAETRIIFTTPDPVEQHTVTYNGCIFTRSDRGVDRIEDLNGRPFAYSDETSTSGHIFARTLFNRSGILLGNVYFAGGHANVIQAIHDGKVAGGAAFYSPPSAREMRDHSLVGDARRLILRRMQTEESRRSYLEEVRILALTDPIPNDLACVRRGFPRRTWEKFEASLRRFLATEQGRGALFDLVAAVDVNATDDRAFDPFREALRSAGMNASQLLEAEEAKARERQQPVKGTHQ